MGNKKSVELKDEYEVVEVIDGDTIRCKGPNFTFDVRLLRIDCPEMHPKKTINDRELHMKKAILVKLYLKRKIEGKKVNIIFNGKMSFTRRLGEVYYQGTNLSDKLLKKKYAKLYDKNKERTWSKNELKKIKL